MVKAIQKYGIFFVIPFLALAYTLSLNISAGPYWLAPNFDPSYQYLVNGLYLIKGFVPNHTDHPGTPLQILSCAVCWVLNIGRPASDVVRNVLLAPEFYLHMIFALITALGFFTSLIMGVYVYRAKKDTLLALMIQMPILSLLIIKPWESTEPILPVVGYVSPEPLLISVMNLFNICLLMNFFAKNSKDELFSTLFWGVVCGLGAAVKLTFIPILVVPLIVLNWKNKIIFAGVFAVSFVMWTLPIISKYPVIWGGISGFVTHRGVYGSGGGEEIFNYLINLKDIIIEHRVFSAVMLTAMILLFWKLACKRWDRGTFFLLAIIAGIYVQFGSVAKHPGEHYLLPGLGLFGPLLGLIFLQSFSENVLGRKIFIGFVLIFTVISSWQAMEYAENLAAFTKDIRAFYEHINAKYQGFVFLGHYRSSGQASALRFGDGWNGESKLKDELFQLYPNCYFLNLGGGTNRIVNFEDRVFSNDLMSHYPGVIFQGDDTFDMKDSLAGSPFTVRLLDKGRVEDIYLLTKSTEKQALTCFVAAVRFFQAGEYAKALTFAIESKTFHYQPESDVDTFIRFLGTHVQ